MTSSPAGSPAETYESYLVPALFTPWAELLIKHAQPKAGESVLDVACGSGIVGRLLVSAVLPGGSVTGVDYNPQMLEVARVRAAQESLDIDYVHSSAESMPIAASSVDLLVCQQGLQFFPDQPGAVREFLRVLRPGGRAVIAVWSAIERQSAYALLDESVYRLIGLHAFGTPFAFGPAARMEALLAEVGFRDVSVDEFAMDIAFPQPEMFVRHTVMAAVAVMSDFKVMAPRALEDVIASVQDDVRPRLAEMTSDGMIRSSSASLIASARRPAQP